LADPSVSGAFAEGELETLVDPVRRYGGGDEFEQ
jgi:hypothetical protein